MNCTGTDRKKNQPGFLVFFFRFFMGWIFLSGRICGFVLDCLFVHLWDILGVLQQNLKIVMVMGVDLETGNALFGIRQLITEQRDCCLVKQLKCRICRRCWLASWIEANWPLNFYWLKSSKIKRSWSLFICFYTITTSSHLLSNFSPVLFCCGFGFFSLRGDTAARYL